MDEPQSYGIMHTKELEKPIIHLCSTHLENTR